ncbi:TetR/AcrR family transcriptional regulator [Microbacteriaceae bacterium VKM Ac-2855]|nr:TetR/AcrR family transcriptional regulator [Microbacteriaceae bacterium VKM Ac-2855]
MTGETSRTQEVILGALIEVIEEVGSDDVSYKLIARRAGVGERTIFRYYPTRSDLLAAAGAWIEEHVFTPVPFDSVFDLPLALRVSMEAYDSRPELAYVSAETGIRDATPDSPRALRIRTAVDTELAGVEERERRHLVAALTHLDSAATWVTLHRDLGLARADVADAAAWAAETALDPVRDRVG